jgi:hypothetical protein
MSPLDGDHFLGVARAILGPNYKIPDERFTGWGTYRSFFGASPKTCAVIWRKIERLDQFPVGMKPVHLLWGLYWLWTYAKGEPCAALVGTTRKTFRKWVWLATDCMAALMPSLVSHRRLQEAHNSIRSHLFPF